MNEQSLSAAVFKICSTIKLLQAAHVGGRPVKAKYKKLGPEKHNMSEARQMGISET